MSQKLAQCWIHETETSEGWMTDVHFHEAAHLEQEPLSDGFTHWISKADYDRALDTIAKLKKRLGEDSGD